MNTSYCFLLSVPVFVCKCGYLLAFRLPHIELCDAFLFADVLALNATSNGENGSRKNY